MLSIISLTILCILITISLKIRNAKILKLFLIFIINILVLEVLAYGLLVYQANQSNAFFLIGNQKFLDKIIKNRLITMIYSDENSHNRYFQVDNNLGYALGKNKSHQIFSTNNQLMRGKKNYPLTPNPNTLRMMTLGDSYIFGDGEHAENTWPFILDKSWKNFEILNLGVSGYGLGQSYLKFLQDGLKFHPDIVFINYINLGYRDTFQPKSVLEKDLLKRSTAYRVHFGLQDNVLTSSAVSPLDFFNQNFRKRFVYLPLEIDIDRMIFSRKLFSHLNTGLLLKNIFLRKAVADTPVPEDRDQKILTAKLLTNLIEQIKQIDSKLIFFSKGDFSKQPKEIQKTLLIHANYVVYIDSEKLLQSHFDHYKVTKEELMNPTNHYNARGNYIHAIAVGSILKDKVWGAGERRFKLDKASNTFIRLK